MSRSEVSWIGRGLAGAIAAAVSVHVATALDARLDIALQWPAEGLDRLLESAHAQLVGSGVHRSRQMNPWRTFNNASIGRDAGLSVVLDPAS